MSTQQNQTVEKANNIVDLLEKINNHSDVKKVLVKYEDTGKVFLEKEDTVKDKELKTLIDTLNQALNDDLISDQGQHSDVYYELQNNNKVNTKVFEKDSFGPLIVGIKYVPDDWWVTYG